MVSFLRGRRMAISHAARAILREPGAVILPIAITTSSVGMNSPSPLNMLRST
ncbi:hypothetical protein D3C83_320440 [compost metagenome]